MLPSLFRLSLQRGAASSSFTLIRTRFIAAGSFQARAFSKAFTPRKHLQDEVYEESIRDPEKFWAHQAEQVVWHKKPSQVYEQSTRTLEDGTSHTAWKWFPDGEISTTYNCVDRHVKEGRGENVAIIWDSPVTGQKQKFTYNQLLDEVEVLAGVLRQQGIEKGDVVLVYMPMIPQALFALLAIARLGAIHSVVFGGFAGKALADRVDGCAPKIIMTASCGIEGAKKAQSYKPMITAAIEQSTHKPEKVIIWQRDQLPWDGIDESKGIYEWQSLVEKGKSDNTRAEAVPVKADDPLYVIYTSGTTSSPKGVQREAGGHLVGLHLSMPYLFGIRKPGDVMFTASDIGWVVGHCYILYGPLLAGATTVLFEGKPIGTPDASTFWRIIEEHKVNTMFTAPTALRAIRKEDPDAKFLKEIGERGGLKQLRGLFVAGERSEPSIITAYQKLIEQYAAPGAQVIDNWWSTEVGSPITGLALTPSKGKDFNATEIHEALPIKPGSAGKPQPGFNVMIVNDEGEPVEQGAMGNIVLGIPLAPAGFTTLWNDPQRFWKSYLQRFDGKYVDTSDAGMIDHDGFVHVMSRSDDIINVAAHRFSTGAIEQAITSHPSVAEACVVGVPDDLKGHLPLAFATLAVDDHPNSAVPDEKLLKEVNSLVREQIGAVASLGGMVQGKGMIPKTRSGKTLRRVLRDLVDNAVEGNFEKEVNIPATVEDASVVDVAREKIKEYFKEKGDLHRSTESKSN